MDVTIRIPRAAEEIIDKLNRHGFEAYVVGGCVRDALLGREPGDWDITTSAKPEQVKAVFGRTIDTGIQHGTVTLLRGRCGYEVTTYRIDGEYEDGRHPKSVEFTSELVEDLKRRDFTMNAMAYNHISGLVDVFGGQQDMKERLIRCVGRAEDRFTEDALRILRALRFAAQLDFEIEAETEAAVRRLAPNLVHVSKERIQMELTKLLLSDHPDQIRRVFDCGAAPYVSETFVKISPENISVSPHLPARKSLRWAAFLRHQDAAEAKQILRELKLDNDTISAAGELVEWWRKPLGETQAELRQVMSRMTPELFDDLILLKTEAAGYDRIPETRADLARIQADAAQIRARGDCISLKTLAVSGDDLIAAGMKPGKEMGAVLSRLLRLVLEHPEKNTKEELMKTIPGPDSR